MKEQPATWLNDVSRWINELKLAPLGPGQVWMASDYSKLSDGVQTFSYLLTSPAQSGAWNDRRKAFRQKVADKIRWTSMSGAIDSKHREFSDIGKELRGALIIVSVKSSDVSDQLERDQALQFRTTGHLKASWSPLPLWRGLAIARLASLVACALTLPSTKLEWVSDNDDVLATDAHIEDVLRFARSTWRRSPNASMQFWTTSNDSQCRLLEDLCSFADVASGYFHHFALHQAWPSDERGRFVEDWLSSQATGIATRYLFLTGDAERVNLSGYSWN